MMPPNHESPAGALTADYPWIQHPLIVGAPMRLIATAPLAVAITLGAGIGFIGSGTDVSTLSRDLEESSALLEQSQSSHVKPSYPAPVSSASGKRILPIGVGVICWGASLHDTVATLEKAPSIPAALWLFAPEKTTDLSEWCRGLRRATGNVSKIWIQIGGVAEALQLCSDSSTLPDVLVVQGVDAGGHGLNSGASFVSLLPEVSDALDAAVKEGTVRSKPQLIAAGGISDGRGVAAAVAVGASGIVLGTRYLASPEAVIANGYRNEVLRAKDGGQTTVRSSVYDYLRGTTGWPKRYGGRGVTNQSYEDWIDERIGKDENKRLYDKTMKEQGDEGWGPGGRMTTYAGTSVGLVKEIKPAKTITEEVRAAYYTTIRILL